MSYFDFFIHRLPTVLRQVRSLKRHREVKFYAVAVGNRPGIYRTWPSCKVQINNIANAKFKRFDHHEDAMQYLKENTYETPIIKQSFDKPPGNVREATVYIDGSCYHNGQPDARAAMGIFWPEMPEHNVSREIEGRQTSVRAELMAAITALKQAKEMQIDCLTVYADSHYVIHAATHWIYNWRKNGYITSSGHPVKNKEDMMEFERAILALPKIIWKPVAGHSGNRGNDQADLLASLPISDLFVPKKQQQISALKSKLEKPEQSSSEVS